MKLISGVLQLIQHDIIFPFVLRRTNSTVGIENQILFEIRDDGDTNTQYAKIAARIKDNIDTQETEFLDLWVVKDGILGQYLVLDGPQLSLGLVGERAVLDASNISGGSKIFGFPNTTGDVVIDAHPNVFTDLQTIEHDADFLLDLYRPNNTVSEVVGINFDAENDTNERITYGRAFVSIQDPTTDSENGLFYIVLNENGSLKTRLMVYNNGNIFIGTNQSKQRIKNPR